jgi:hypothetical protein
MDAIMDNSGSNAIAKQQIENDHQSAMSSSGINEAGDNLEKPVESGNAVSIKHKQNEIQEAGCGALSKERVRRHRHGCSLYVLLTTVSIRLR